MSDTTETEHGVDMKESKPVAWIRYCSDGSFEGPIMDNLIEDVRKESGAWTPLFAKREKVMNDELRDERDAEIARLRDVLIHKGFVECDIPACNCGSWHHKYGLPERWAEIKEVLIDADALNNDTGNMPLNAIKKLISQLAERDAETARLREDAFTAGMTRAVDIAKAIAESESAEGNDSYGVGWQIADRILKTRKVKGRE